MRGLMSILRTIRSTIRTLLSFGTKSSKELGKKLNSCRVSDFICIFAILKEVFCKDTHFLRKDKARACESLGFVVNKNVFFQFRIWEKEKNEKGAP